MTYSGERPVNKEKYLTKKGLLLNDKAKMEIRKKKTKEKKLTKAQDHDE